MVTKIQTKKRCACCIFVWHITSADMLHKVRPQQQTRHIWTFEERLKTFESICQQIPKLFGFIPKCAREVYLSNEYLLNLVNYKSKMAKAEMRCERGKQKLDQIYVKWPGEHFKNKTAQIKRLKGQLKLRWKTLYCTGSFKKAQTPKHNNFVIGKMRFKKRLLSCVTAWNNLTQKKSSIET